MSLVLTRRIQGIVNRFNKEIIDASTKDVKMIPEIRTRFDEATGIFQLHLVRITGEFFNADNPVPEKMAAAMAEGPVAIEGELTCEPESEGPSS